MTVRHGIDYAFARPNLAAVKAAGKTFVVRYVSGGHSSKDITRSELANLRAHGLDVCLVWETGGSAALGGRAKGIEHAQIAKAQVAALGMTGTPVYFAVDFDAVGSQLVTVSNYIAGAASVLGHDLTGVYGGYHVVETVSNAHVCRWFWQTYAWSYGKWSTHAQLRQVHNGATVGGGAVDLCDAVTADFGQFPRPSAPKPPLPPGGSGSGVPVPPSPHWTRNLTLHSSGADVTHFLGHIRPEGPAQIAAAAAHGLAPVIDQATWSRIRTIQSHHPTLWGERAAQVVGPKTYRAISGHA